MGIYIWYFWSNKHYFSHFSIIIVFEISAFVGFVYDLILQICKYVHVLVCLSVYT